MGHGWKSHGGTWKMGRWGWNIAPKMLHVLVGYVLGARTTQSSKRASCSSLKLDMFWGVVGFEVQVLWHAIFDWPKWTFLCVLQVFLLYGNQYLWDLCHVSICFYQNMTCFHVNLLQTPCCQCVKTGASPPQSEWCIYNLSLK